MLFFSLTLTLLSACQPYDKSHKSNLLLKEIEELITTANYGEAKCKIDTLILNFSEQDKALAQGLKYLDIIEKKEFERNVHYRDSLLLVLENRLLELQEDFIFEVSQTEGLPGRYIHKNQQVEHVVGRSLLRANVYENGKLFISSHYAGSQYINHTHVRVGKDDLFIETLPITEDNGFNRRFDDGAGTYWEVVIYTPENDRGVARFIKENLDADLTLEFLGGIENALSDLPLSDKEAIVAAAELSAVLRNQKEAKKLLN